jgi:hypothetical protein
MTHRIFQLFSFSVFSFLSIALAQVELRWESQIERPSSYTAVAYRGETIRLMPRLVRGTIPAETTNSAAVFFWQTNGMGSAWWSKPATVSTAEPGRVEAIFAATNDFGADRYTWFVRLDGSEGSAYRAFGTLAMNASPGWSPTAAPAPGYQWVSPADMQAAIDAATNPIPTWINAATNPIPAQTAAAINAATNPIPAARAAAIAAATNPIPAARAAAIAAATNPVPGWISAATNAIPRVPTNAVTGWLLYDAGSNKWLRVSVSNYSYYISEVL